MSKENKLQLLSPLFLKYQTEFEKNSRSRVFAPLAEAYRKLGMTDKAMEILSQGIRFHPAYIMGYLGLAFCYFDLKQYNLAYSTLLPLVDQNRDNLRLLKLFSEICLELGKQEEALETLKYLLFVNPRDKEVAQTVLKLEQTVEERYKPHHKPIIIPENELSSGYPIADESEFFNLDKLEGINTTPKKVDYDDWMTVDLKNESKPEVVFDKNAQTVTPKIDYDQWNVKKVDQTFENQKIEILNPSDFLDDEDIDDNNYEHRNYTVHLNLDEDHEEIQNEEDFSENNYSNQSEAPLVTHTLVDLYCGQGHMEKALEVLEKILILNPKDQKTIKKIEEIKALVQPFDQYDEEEKKIEDNLISIQPSHTKEVHVENSVSEEEGRRHLMSLIDEKLGPIEIQEENSRIEISRLVEEKLSLFLRKIQKRALDYQGRV